MGDVSYEDAIVELVRSLEVESRRRVFEYARSLQPPSGISGAAFLERTADIAILASDLEIMARAIEEECERIEVE
jgi:hypothetical protein